MCYVTCLIPFLYKISINLCEHIGNQLFDVIHTLDYFLVGLGNNIDKGKIVCCLYDSISKSLKQVIKMKLLKLSSINNCIIFYTPETICIHMHLLFQFLFDVIGIMEKITNILFSSFVTCLILTAFPEEKYAAAVNDIEFDLQNGNWIDPGKMFDHDSPQIFEQISKSDQMGEQKSENFQGNEKKTVTSSSNIDNYCDCPETRQQLQLQQNDLQDIVNLLIRTKMVNNSRNSDGAESKNINDIYELFRKSRHLAKVLFLNHSIRPRPSNKAIYFFSVRHCCICDTRPVDTETLSLTVSLSKYEQKLLQDVLRNKRPAATVDDILLAALFSNPGAFVSTSTYVFEEIIFISFGLVILIKMNIFANLISYTRHRCFLSLFVVAAVISTFKEWINFKEFLNDMQKGEEKKKKEKKINKNSKEIAKQQVTMMEFKNIDDACRKKSNSWFWSVFFVQDTSCQDYVETIYINPFWKVTIFQAITEVISKMLTQPIAHLGRALSEFIHIMAKDLPWYLSQPYTFIVILFILFLIYVVISYLFGIGLRIRFLGLTIMETTNTIASPLPSSLSPPIGEHVKQPNDAQCITQKSVKTNQLCCSSQNTQELKEGQNFPTDEKSLMKSDKNVITVNVQMFHLNDSQKTSNNEKQSADHFNVGETKKITSHELEKVSLIAEKLKDLSLSEYHNSIKDHQNEVSCRNQKILDEFKNLSLSNDISIEEKCSTEVYRKINPEDVDQKINNEEKPKELYEGIRPIQKCPKSDSKISIESSNSPSKDETWTFIENKFHPHLQDDNISSTNILEIDKNHKSPSMDENNTKVLHNINHTNADEIEPIASSEKLHTQLLESPITSEHCTDHLSSK
ncbi:Chloride channel CLIC-like protein 1 [Nymphon striatum]|nr:Chloride channel CLIC-like protein 1 [Nymphon striatum]